MAHSSQPRTRPARRRGWFIAGVLLLLAALYFVLMFPAGCGRLIANHMMLFPTTGAIPAPGTHDVYVATPAGRMHVVVARGGFSAGDEQPQRYVVCYVGNGGRAEYYASYIAARWDDEPTEVWAMNHPGFGESDGPARLERMPPAAMAVYDEVSRIAADRPVYLDADSMGTTLALHVAAERRGPQGPAALVLKNAPPLRELVMGRFGWWNLWLGAWPVACAVPREMDSIANARRSEAPAVFVMADLDTMVPPAYQRRIINAYAGRAEVITLTGAQHNAPIDAASELAIREAIRLARQEGRD